MGLILTRPSVEALAHELANFAREDVTDAVEAALSERLERLRDQRQMKSVHDAELLAWFAELDARPRSMDPRSWKEIEDQEMYDERGNPIG